MSRLLSLFLLMVITKYSIGQELNSSDKLQLLFNLPNVSSQGRVTIRYYHPGNLSYPKWVHSIDLSTSKTPHFRIPLKHNYGYLIIEISNDKVSGLYTCPSGGYILCAKGDSINLSTKSNVVYDGTVWEITGQGRSKYEYQLNSTVRRNLNLSIDMNGIMLKEQATCYDAIKELSTWRPLIPSLEFEILKADVIGKIYSGWVTSFSLWWWQKGEVDEKFKSNALRALERKDREFDSCVIENSAQLISAYYLLAIIKRQSLASIIEKEETKGYFNLISSYSGKIRDQLLYLYAERNLSWLSSKNKTQIGSDLKMRIESKEIAVMIDSMPDAREDSIHAKAFIFNLPDVNGKMRSLAEFSGKVVFIDFWYTGCGPCKAYYNNVLGDVEKTFRNDDRVVFITISIDRNFDQWKESVNSLNYTSNEAINLFTEGEGDLHTVIKKYDVSQFPRPILIDKKGVIRNRSNTELRKKEQLIKMIKNLSEENES